MARGLWQHACVLILAAFAWTGALPACYRTDPCRDPLNDGMCYCPVGDSCRHTCNAAVPNCTLGCGQRNQTCSATCVDDCTALCGGAQQCDITCGDRCSVSCEWVKQSCVAQVGASSHVNCQGAADCDVRCQGTCDVNCAQGQCRVRCADPKDCEIDCGGGTPPRICPDGSRVCNRAC